jgi:hypothetical protein
MSNLTYNPNINIPYNNSGYNNNSYNSSYNSSYNNGYNSSYNGQHNMDINESNGNFKSYDTYDNTPPLLQQMDPRVAPDMELPRQPIRRQQFGNQQNYNDLPPMKRKKSRKAYYTSEYDNEKNIDTFEDTKSSKFDWVLFGKKIIIYTALFLIMSHVKMDDLVCKFIPFLSDNQILCMTFKGMLLAVIIILVQKIL